MMNATQGAVQRAMERRIVNGVVRYYADGQLHRPVTEGPAVISPAGGMSFYEGGVFKFNVPATNTKSRYHKYRMEALLPKIPKLSDADLITACEIQKRPENMIVHYIRTEGKIKRVDDGFKYYMGKPIGVIVAFINTDKILIGWSKINQSKKHTETVPFNKGKAKENAILRGLYSTLEKTGKRSKWCMSFEGRQHVPIPSMIGREIDVVIERIKKTKRFENIEIGNLSAVE